MLALLASCAQAPLRVDGARGTVTAPAWLGEERVREISASLDDYAAVVASTLFVDGTPCHDLRLVDIPIGLIGGGDLCAGTTSGEGADPVIYVDIREIDSLDMAQIVCHELVHDYVAREGWELPNLVEESLAAQVAAFFRFGVPLHEAWAEDVSLGCWPDPLITEMTYVDLTQMDADDRAIVLGNARAFLRQVGHLRLYRLAGKGEATPENLRELEPLFRPPPPGGG